MKSLKRIRSRWKRCYELAAKAMLEEPGAEKFTLVHGLMLLGKLPIPHAWIETGDGRVYDPVQDTYTPIENYGCIVERRYSRVEAARMISLDGTWGPWHGLMG